jgi:hypothetical protein
MAMPFLWVSWGLVWVSGLVHDTRTRLPNEYPVAIVVAQPTALAEWAGIHEASGSLAAKVRLKLLQTSS